MITGYRAVIAAEKAGVGFTAYVSVGLNKHTKTSQEAFERAVTAAQIQAHPLGQPRTQHLGNLPRAPQGRRRLQLV